jgi:hypothetical protein
MSWGNRSSFVTVPKIVTTAGVAVQLPDIKIPDGFFAIVMADPKNTGYIYPGETKDIAEYNHANDICRLEGGDSIPIPLTNLNLVWIDSSEDGEGVSCIVPQ